MKQCLIKNLKVSNKFTYKKHKINKFFGTVSVPRPGDSNNKTVTLIPGVGIGREISDCLIRVNKALMSPINWDIIDEFSFEDERYLKNKCIIKGPKIIQELNNKKINRVEEHVYLAKKLGLFSNVIHAYSIPGIRTRHSNIDIIVVREGTEGEYSGLEHEVYPGVIESIKVITKQASIRIAEYAFETAYLNGRKKVTAVHKANIMKLCDGQFLEATREVAKKYPLIKYEEMIIDNCCMQMISNPNQFDVMVLPNLYGKIVGSVAIGIGGGPGLFPGAMIGNDYALFEVGARQPAFDIAGKGIANPTAIILSYSMLLRHLGLKYFAEKLDKGVYSTLQNSQIKTPDIGGNATSIEFTNELIKNLI